jgi:hypothetical protein
MGRCAGAGRDWRAESTAFRGFFKRKLPAGKALVHVSGWNLRRPLGVIISEMVAQGDKLP